MKLLVLQQAEQQTLRDMGVFHPHPRVRIRAQAIVRLSQGLTLQQTANEFHVHLNSIETWRQRWNRQGLMGLYEGHHTGRKRKWTAQQQEALRVLAQPTAAVPIVCYGPWRKRKACRPSARKRRDDICTRCSSATSATATV